MSVVGALVLSVVLVLALYTVARWLWGFVRFVGRVFGLVLRGLDWFLGVGERAVLVCARAGWHLAVAVVDRLAQQ